MANYLMHPYATMPSQPPSCPDLDHDQSNEEDVAGKKKKPTKSQPHMSLLSSQSYDEGRPCQRWCVRSRIVGFRPSRVTDICLASNVKQVILPRRAASTEEQAGHDCTTTQCRNVPDHTPYVILCCDSPAACVDTPTELIMMYGNATLQQSSNSPWAMNVPQNTFLYQPETLGNEFSVLTCVSATISEFTSMMTVLH